MQECTKLPPQRSEILREAFPQIWLPHQTGLTHKKRFSQLMNKNNATKTNKTVMKNKDINFFLGGGEGLSAIGPLPLPPWRPVPPMSKILNPLPPMRQYSTLLGILRAHLVKYDMIVFTNLSNLRNFKFCCNLRTSPTPPPSDPCPSRCVSPLEFTYWLEDNQITVLKKIQFSSRR